MVSIRLTEKNYLKFHKYNLLENEMKNMKFPIHYLFIQFLFRSIFRKLLRVSNNLVQSSDQMPFLTTKR
jgi:hypothetical protein